MDTIKNFNTQKSPLTIPECYYLQSMRKKELGVSKKVPLLDLCIKLQFGSILTTQVSPFILQESTKKSQEK